MEAYENKANIIFGYVQKYSDIWFYRVLTVTEDSITESDLSQFNFSSSYGSAYHFADEDHIFVVSDEGLFLLDLQSGEAQSILNPDNYHSDIASRRNIIKLEDGNFLYIRDDNSSSNDSPNQWIIYNSEGQILSYQEPADPKVYGAGTSNYFQKDDTLYISYSNSFPPRFLRCQINLDYTLDFSLTTIEGASGGLYNLHPFGDDKIEPFVPLFGF